MSSTNTIDSGNTPIKEPENGVNLKRIIFRALPYWPLFPIVIALFLIGTRFYLKYQVPVYVVSARVVVNDGEQEKSSNLFQAIRPINSVDRETEREKEILQSKSLVTQVVRDLQLNVEWVKKGRVAKLPQFGDLPLNIFLESPDSVKKTVTGEVKLLKNGVEFDGQIFPFDSLVQSSFGKIRWHLNNVTHFTNEWTLTVVPLKVAAGKYRGKLSAVPISKQSALIDLTVRETVPARGELFLNTLLDQYGKNNVAFKNRVYQNTVKFVEERLNLIADELSGVESKIQNYKSKEGIINLGSQGAIFLDQLKEADGKAAETDIQLTVLQKIEQYVNNRNRSSEAVPATLGLTDPILLSLLNQLYQAEFETEKLRKLSGDKNPQLEVLEESVQKLRPSILASIRNLKSSLQSSKDKFAFESTQLMGQLRDIPEKERALLDISRQQQIKNNIYTYLLQKREESVTAAAAQVPNHRVINAPELGGQVAPRPTIVYTFAFFVALMLVLLYVYLREFSSKKVLFSTDIELHTGLPLLGELVYSQRADSASIIKPSERIMIAEQIRDLRTNLSYTHIKKEGAQVLLITSSLSGEGKSFLTVNLVAALSRVDKKILLIECDLRKPTICKKLGMSPAKGLTDYLIGAAEVSEVVRAVEQLENVFFISSGPIPPNPVELLMNGRLQSLMKELKKDYDYIVIDAPPVAIITDAKVLAAEADSTLYVVRYNYTPMDLLNFIREQAVRKTLPNISIVFNGVVNKKVFGYGYRYGYGYGYGYGNEYVQEETVKKGIFSKYGKAKKK